MTNHIQRSLLLVAIAGGILVGARDACAQTPEAHYYRAYWLEEERGELASALDLYRSVARARGADEELRRQAESRAAAVAEDLACSDFARLMPPETILFVEVKTRTGGLGIEQAVGPKKQRNLCLSARCYLDREGMARENYRFMILYVVYPLGHQGRIRIIPLEDPF